MTDNRRERAAHAMRVYDKEFVHELFGFAHPGSTRKLMSRYEVTAVVGYPVEDIEYILQHWDPDKAWPRRHDQYPKKTKRVGTGRPATNRRK